MKNSALILLLIVSYPITAQKIGDIVKLKSAVPVSETTFIKNNPVDKSEPNFIEYNYGYTIQEITDTYVVLDPWFFGSSMQDALLYNDKLFKISRADFDRYANVKENEERDILSIGLLTLPFKARPRGKNEPGNTLSFDTEFNISSNLNWAFYRALNGVSVNAQIGAGISSVELNSSNSQIKDGQATDAATLSYFLGAMISYKKVQVGLYAGVDHINNQEFYRWKHGGNLWIGFGVGYKVFDVSLGGSNQKKEQKN